MRDITTRTTVPVTTPLRPPRAGKGKPAEEKTAPGIQFPFRQTLRPFLRAQRQARPAGGLFSEPPSPFAGLFQPGVCQTTRTGSCENISKINSVKPKARLFPRTREGAFLLLPLSFLFSPSLFSFSGFLYFFLVLLLFSFPLFLFSLTKAHEGAHPALPGKIGRAGCEAAVRQLPPGHGKSHHARLQQGQFNYRKK